MTDLTDFEHEEDEAKEWLRGNSTEGIGIDDFVEIVCRGHSTCEGNCISRDICGEEACVCIRTVFPTPEHYETYKLARAFYIENLVIRSVAGTASKQIQDGFKGEKNEGKSKATRE